VSPSKATQSPLGTITNPIPEPRTPSGTNLFNSQVYSPPHEEVRQGAGHLPLLLGPAPMLATLHIQHKWPKCMTWTINTAATCEHCGPEYRVSCQLLAHGPASLDVNDPPNLPDPRGEQVLARDPCHLSRTRILLPIFAGAVSRRDDSKALSILLSWNERYND
jgi:hypothetical protein